ncbi:MAG: glycosyltransferase family 39 protein [Waterburya sp.]
MKSNNHSQSNDLAVQGLSSIDFKFHLLFLFAWIILGLLLRFTNLDLKPASSIEISTIGYSLGHGFTAVPLNQVLTIDTLLSPLHFDASIAYVDVWEKLIQESTHPPLYFWLTHWWITLWTTDGALVSLFVARSLSAIFGVLAIPAIFGLACLAFSSWRVAHLSAILMAISPYGIYLAQEARHYTLTVLWVIASLACLVKVVQLIEQKALLPKWLLFLWILINALGFATHYFFALALGAEVFALFGCWFVYRFDLRYWRSLFLVAIGTGVSYLAWLPVVMGISNNELTDWIKTSFELGDLFQPLLRLFAWMVTMVMLLPFEGVSLVVAIISGLVLLGILIWSIPILIRGWRSQFLNLNSRLPMVLFTSYFFGSIILILLVIYGVGKDMSLAARYHFLYFPVLLLLVAASLAAVFRGKFGFYNELSIVKVVYSISVNRLLVVFLSICLLGSITVVTNLGFQKSRHSDRLAAYVQDNLLASTKNTPVLTAMTYKTHSELRELIGLALSFEQMGFIDYNLYFLLLESDIKSFGLSQSFDLVAVNLDLDQEQLAQLGCVWDSNLNLPNSGYDDSFYHCRL